MVREQQRGFRHVVLSASVAGLAVVAMLAWSSAATAAVKYPDFSSTDGLNVNGSAAQVDDVLRLTDATFDETGSAFTEKRVVDPEKSFKTQFRFSLHDAGNHPADGMAFVIQRQDPLTVGTGGGGLGYGTIQPSLIVEIDVFDNEATDPDGNHIALMEDGNADDHLESATPSFSLYGDPRSVWIKYSVSSKRLKVYAAEGNQRPNNPLISRKHKLTDVFDGKAYAGFTAATGGEYMAQDVRSWKLKSG